MKSIEKLLAAPGTTNEKVVLGLLQVERDPNPSLDADGTENGLPVPRGV